MFSGCTVLYLSFNSIAIWCAPSLIRSAVKVLDLSPLNSSLWRWLHVLSMCIKLTSCMFWYKNSYGAFHWCSYYCYYAAWRLSKASKKSAVLFDTHLISRDLHRRFGSSLSSWNWLKDIFSVSPLNFAGAKKAKYDLNFWPQFQNWATCVNVKL